MATGFKMKKGKVMGTTRVPGWKVIGGTALDKSVIVIAVAQKLWGRNIQHGSSTARALTLC